MELSNNELDKYLLTIFTGKKVVSLEHKNKDVYLVFKQPDNYLKLKATNKYELSYKDALNQGLLSIEDLEKLITERKLYTEKDDEDIERLESKLEAQQVLLSKTKKVQANKDRINKAISELELQVYQIKLKKYSKLMMSANTKAEEDRMSFLCWACTNDLENEEPYWDSYEKFMNEEHGFRSSAVSKFSDFYQGISTEVIRFIARSGLWRVRYINSMKTTSPLFDRVSTDYTNDQLNLVYWSNYYQNIYEMMPEDRPSDEVIDDDKELDEYMNGYYKDRTKEASARRIDRKSDKGRLSAFSKEEVIVTKSNELYEEIEYDKPREAQRIKNRADIKKRTKRGRR